MESMIDIFFIAFSSILFIGFCVFWIYALQEGARRAAVLAFLSGVLSVLLLLLVMQLPERAKQILFIVCAALGAIGGMLFVLPIGRVERGEDRRTQRFDERDVVFARSGLTPGSQEFKTYYDLHPQNLDDDNRIRALPGLLSKEARKVDVLIFDAADSSFDITGALRHAVNGPVAPQKAVRDARVFTRFIKGWARHMGALDVGVAVLQPEHVYSHVGRGTGTYGAPIELDHRYAIAFSVEMSDEIMGLAPEAPAVMESARKYVDAAVIAISLANLCRRLGYAARAHIDGNYRLIAPLVARQAGLGEIGRMGILMTPRQGPRVRLGVVTTNLPLVTDEAGNSDAVIDFCRICTKCAYNCPSRAIPFGARKQIDGAMRWKLDEMKCFQYWNAIGTDCGLCMAVCPYAHPDNFMHNIVRTTIKRSGFARRIAVRLDDLFYGRKPSSRTTPHWLETTQAQGG